MLSMRLLKIKQPVLSDRDYLAHYASQNRIYPHGFFDINRLLDWLLGGNIGRSLGSCLSILNFYICTITSLSTQVTCSIPEVLNKVDPARLVLLTWILPVNQYRQIVMVTTNLHISSDNSNRRACCTHHTQSSQAWWPSVRMHWKYDTRIVPANPVYFPCKALPQAWPTYR